MKIKDAINYFSRFDPEESIAVIGVDLGARRHFLFGGYEFVDHETPVILLEVSGSGPLEDIAEVDS